MTKLRSPFPGTYFELTENGIETKYKKTFQGFRAWLTQFWCSHPNNYQKTDQQGIYCSKCGWARSGKSRAK